MIRIALSVAILAASTFTADARNTQGRSSLGNPPNKAQARTQPDIDRARFRSGATFYTGLEIQRR